ncbi:hypothetical protein [Gordonia crocea]|nr:hypothetical protein [Gordonia crocea]
MAPAFDIPPSADPNLAGTSPVGVRWADTTLVTAIGLAPARPVVRAHSAGGSAAVGGPDTAVDLNLLAAFRRSARVPLSIDLAVTEHRYCGAGSIAAAYSRSLGSLPVAAARQTTIVLRLPAVTAVPPRAPGATAAAVLGRAALVTRRLAALLAAHGVRTHIFDAAALTDHTEQLLGPPGAARRVFALTPATTPAHLRAVAADHAVAHTTALRLSGSAPHPRLDGLLGVTEVPRAGRALRAVPPGLDPLDDGADDALADLVPTDAVRATALPDLAADPISLADWRFLLGDDGVLIGAAHDGSAVTAPLISSPDHPASVIGDPRFIALLVYRCIGAGAAINLHSPQPHRWARLVDLVDDPGVLALGPARPGAAALTRVDLFDESSEDAEHWQIRLRRAVGDRAAGDWEAGPAPRTVIRGSRADPRIDLVVDGRPHRLTGAASEPERTLVAAL